MNAEKHRPHFIAILSFMAVLMANVAFAGNVQKTATKLNRIAVAEVAIRGYDPVAYFESGKPTPGNGYHTATHHGVTYLFARKEHQEKFNANPEKYAPQYGGYCAYGVAVGKKFYTDPTAWKIVDGKLYLNLDKKIQSKWNEDITGYIEKADTNWTTIQDKHPSEL